MRRLVAADWIRIRRHWLGRALLALLLVILVFQLDGKADRLSELEAELAAIGAAGGPQTPLDELEATSFRLEAESLRENLRFPAVIGYGARLATDVGWFFLIVLTAVLGGEEFVRGTLSSQLARGVGRARYLAASFVSLWLATGVAVLAVTVLAAALGPGVHARVAEDRVALGGLIEALLVPGRVWLAAVPFIIATLFWAVLGRGGGPAMGVGLSIHFLEFTWAQVLPILVVAGTVGGGELPAIYRAVVRLFSVTLGFSADILIHWGLPTVKAAGAVGATELRDTGLLPTSPWRAAALVVGYSALFLGWTMWILRRRDVTRAT